MAEFLTPLRVVQVDRRRWQLEGVFMYASDVLGRVIAVPHGFITDFASVPRLPLAYLAAGNKAQGPAVIHDWLYSTQEVDRATADDVFREAVLTAGHSSATAWLMWAGVRLGGWVGWNKPNLRQPRHIELPEYSNAP